MGTFNDPCLVLVLKGKAGEWPKTNEPLLYPHVAGVDVCSPKFAQKRSAYSDCKQGIRIGCSSEMQPKCNPNGIFSKHADSPVDEMGDKPWLGTGNPEEQVG